MIKQFSSFIGSSEKRYDINEIIPSLLLNYATYLILLGLNISQVFSFVILLIIEIIAISPLVLLKLKIHNKLKEEIYFAYFINDILTLVINYWFLNRQFETRIILLIFVFYNRFLKSKIIIEFDYKEKILFLFLIYLLLEFHISFHTELDILRFILLFSNIMEFLFEIIKTKFEMIQFNYFNKLASTQTNLFIENDMWPYCIYNKEKGILFLNYKFHEILSLSHSNCNEFFKNISYSKNISLFDFLSSNAIKFENGFEVLHTINDQNSLYSYLFHFIRSDENVIIKLINFTEQEKLIQKKIHKLYIGMIQLFFTHESRNQLNPIKILLKESAITNKNEQMFQCLCHFKILCSKLDLISEYANIQKENFNPIEEKFYTKKFLNSLKNLMVKIEKNKMNEISLTCNIDSSIPNCIMIDKKSIKSVLIHIVMNAVKFTYKGSIKIFAQYSQEDNEIIFVIEDSGVGMTKKQRSRLFTLNEETQYIDETGIIHNQKYGSFICSKICTTLGWKIKACSRIKGNGTVVFLSLTNIKIINEKFNTYDESCVINDTPLFKHLPSSKLTQMKYPNIPFSKQASLRKIVVNKERKSLHFGVLIVDDMNMNREALIRMIGKLEEFVDIFESDNGLKAVEKVKEISIKFSNIFVFMDLDMPVMNGIDASRIIRNLNLPNVEILIYAVTAYDSNEMRDKCKEAGMNDYYVKPISYKTLQNIFSKIKSEYI